MSKRRKVELLLPAGSLDVLKVAIRYGADAVYLGGEAFSLRAKAKNFSAEEMKTGIAYAHAHGARVYVTANIFAHNGDLSEAKAYFEELSAIGPDAVLVADPGMFTLAKTYCRGVDIHISTQANTTNYLSARFWHDLGATRIVTARELSLKEIGQLREEIPEDLEIEAFVHGAMCISYSGRCLLSSYLAGRDANKGLCTHPCRWKYALMEEKRPGEYFPVEENDRGTYIMNSRDLCMVDHLPDLYAAGVDSFKIEGRMKTALYAATAARTYRLAMDAYERDPAEYARSLPWLREQISEGTNRRFTTGFFYGKPGAEDQIYDSSTYVSSYIFIGIVEETEGENTVVFEQKNKFLRGENLEIMKPDGRNIKARVISIRDEEGNDMESAPHPKQILHVQLTEPAEAGDVIRMKSRG